MGDELLIRMYNVGVGDCIYVCIPNDDDGFHILIDCGTISSISLLEKALDDLKSNLPLQPDNQRRLDLLVATHRHRDHIKGFDPRYFRDVAIRNIWLSAVMNPEHPQAQKTMALHDYATKSMRELLRSGKALSPQAQLLASLYHISNNGAVKALRETLPERNQITPIYVHAGMSASSLGLNIPNAEIHILGPEEDIDRYYLGNEADTELAALTEVEAILKPKTLQLDKGMPKNISPADFRVLRSRILSQPLFFAAKDSKIQNNASAVLLIEWKNRRLMFVGDAEWEGEFKEGKHNGSWNVMWKERREHLKSLDFLKIGHHGSWNATPWDGERDNQYEANQILNAILPVPDNGATPTARAVVSTARTNVYKPIPASDLLEELGRRIQNTKNYSREFQAIRDFEPENDLPLYDDYEREWFEKDQPLRTDFEFQLNEQGFVEVTIPPG